MIYEFIPFPTSESSSPDPLDAGESSRSPQNAQKLGDLPKDSNSSDIFHSLVDEQFVTVVCTHSIAISFILHYKKIIIIRFLLKKQFI